MSPCARALGWRSWRQRTLPKGPKQCQADTRCTRPRPEQCWSRSASRRGRRCRRNRYTAAPWCVPCGIFSALYLVRRRLGVGRHVRPR
eukprot:3244863-Lingulodinium_polyedra.AAC.1